MNIPRVLRLSTISTAIVLFLFWGSFFIEHMQEWYFNQRVMPPGNVTFSVIVHGVLLISYLLIIWLEKTGAILIAFCSVLFFIPMLGLKGLPFTLISMIPSIIYLNMILFNKYYVKGSHD